MKESLQNWYKNNIPEDDDMFWKNAMWEQFKFIRDIIPSALIFDNYAEKITYPKEKIFVIETHVSKNIKLPVYRFKWHGIKFFIRHNFHDWKISVVSDKNIYGLEIFNFFDPKQIIKYYECKGFKKEWIYDCYDQCTFRFTCEINNRFDLYCLIKLIAIKYLEEPESIKVPEYNGESTFSQVNKRVTLSNNSNFGFDKLALITQEWIRSLCEVIDQNKGE